MNVKTKHYNKINNIAQITVYYLSFPWLCQHQKSDTSYQEVTAGGGGNFVSKTGKS